MEWTREEGAWSPHVTITWRPELGQSWLVITNLELANAGVYKCLDKQNPKLFDTIKIIVSGTFSIKKN